MSIQVFAKICYAFHVLFFGRLPFQLDKQLGDLRGIFGLIMGTMHMLRTKLKVLDASYGNGTGGIYGALLPYNSISVANSS